MCSMCMELGLKVLEFVKRCAKTKTMVFRN